MSKRIVKKTKIKLLNLLLVLLIFVGLFFGVEELIKVPTKNLLIKGTTYLNDDYLLNFGGLKDYPEFILFPERKVEKEIKKSNYINNCNIKKKWGFLLEINVDENKPLFYDLSKEKYVLSNKEEVPLDDISKQFRVPRLMNYVPDKKYNKFIKEMSNVQIDVLSEIGDIEYQPNDYDKDRFLLYMDDGNMVYLTLTKFKMINQYNKVLSQLEGHKGILYLDSGNHFQIKE
ncbi:MAG: FtsQ-type POTRA domain-containing protein [Bacilli bacterium]|nr:FtsQ-type POTRA domain-containing protein [Bacilli bacterium]